MRLKIIVADDHQIIREGICNMLGCMTDMEVVGEASNGRAAFRLARKRQPDIIIMDISMPELNGIEATRQIKAELPDIKIIALSMYADKRFVLGMLKAGVSGYLLKDCAFSELTDAISVVRKGETYLSSRIADTVRKTLLDQLHDKSSGPSDELTDRERQVLQLIAEGVKTRDIAEQLHISSKTVETYRRHIMEKLDLHSVAELTKFAVREGLTQL